MVARDSLGRWLIVNVILISDNNGADILWNIMIDDGLVTCKKKSDLEKQSANWRRQLQDVALWHNGIFDCDNKPGNYKLSCLFSTSTVESDEG